jgi:hypothetical protein
MYTYVLSIIYVGILIFKRLFHHLLVDAVFHGTFKIKWNVYEIICQFNLPKLTRGETGPHLPRRLV